MHAVPKTEERTYQSAQIVPDFRDVWVETDRTGVCIESVAVLVDLVVKHTDRAPECRIPSVAVDCLLVGFIGLGIFGLGHVTSTEQVPALRIVVICWSGSKKLSLLSPNILGFLTAKRRRVSYLR